MVKANQTYDAFISHAAADVQLAKEIAAACRASGLEAVTNAELSVGDNGNDALWEALAESRALLAILSPSGPTPAMAIELGAARAWNKPIFGVLTDPAMTQLPPGIAGIDLYTTGRIDDVIRSVKQAGQEISESDRELLASLYKSVGVPADQLALEPVQLAQLARRFTSGTGKHITGERLLSELLRMRKRGGFPKLAATAPMKRKGTA